MFYEKIKNTVEKLKSESLQIKLITLATLLVVYFVIIIGSKQMGNEKENFDAKPDIKSLGSEFFFESNESELVSGDVGITVAVFNKFDFFFTSLLRAREISSKNNLDAKFAINEFCDSVQSAGFAIKKEQAGFIINFSDIRAVYNFKNITRDILGNMIKNRDDISDYKEYIIISKENYKGVFIPDEMKNIGEIILEQLSKEFPKKSGIFSIKDNRKIASLAVGVILTLLVIFLIYYIKTFHKEIFANRQKLLILSVVLIISLLIARLVSGFSLIAIPIFIATVLVSILLEPLLGLVINLVLTLIITLIVPIDLKFILMCLVAGSFSAIISAKESKKNRLFLSGITIGVINVLIVTSVNVINKAAWNVIAWDSLITFLNGVGSIVISIGILPFIERFFDIVTPVRLLEIMNPNHVLIKRLLIEAPGTYHHSLMVSNLAEAAAQNIGANALLARAGAYYHDIGKLNRPDFFTENQMMLNPHDRLTPNLSALVITSHTSDGYQLAKKHKIPKAVLDIIKEHHGTSLVAYFYHKAKNSEKGELVTEETFRYPGPKPSSVEGAVVMLADCVEASVRSLPDRTEGKIEGLIRKIIKGKFDDGQLSQCELTFKDIEEIACAFIKVFGGFYHEREQYPDAKDVASKETESIADGMPIKEISTKDMPTEETASKEIPTEEVDSKQIPTEEIASKEMPAKDGATKEKPTNETLPEETLPKEKVAVLDTQKIKGGGGFADTG